jgi:hypothetical protein
MSVAPGRRHHRAGATEDADAADHHGGHYLELALRGDDRDVAEAGQEHEAGQTGQAPQPTKARRRPCTGRPAVRAVGLSRWRRAASVRQEGQELAAVRRERIRRRPDIDVADWTRLMPAKSTSQSGNHRVVMGAPLASMMTMR